MIKITISNMITGEDFDIEAGAVSFHDGRLSLHFDLAKNEKEQELHDKILDRWDGLKIDHRWHVLV